MEDELEARTRPVAMALQRIGIPAIPQLLDEIVRTDEVKTAGKCASLCRMIEGRDVAKFRLQGMLDRETDPKKKERLQSALRILNDLKADN